MIPVAVIVLLEFANRIAQHLLAKEDHAPEALVLDAPHEAVEASVQIQIKAN